MHEQLQGQGFGNQTLQELNHVNEKPLRGQLTRNQSLEKNSRLKGEIKLDVTQNSRKIYQKKDRTLEERRWLESVLKAREEPHQDLVALDKARQQLKKFYHGNISAPGQLHIPDKTPDFKAISGLESILYVHAALWQGDNVRISIIKKRGKLDNILCVFWYSSNQRSNFTVVKALVKDLQSYNFENACAYIKCFLKLDKEREKSSAPVFVGLVNKKTLSAGHRILLPIENRDMDPDRVNRGTTPKISKDDNKNSKPTSVKNRVVEFTVCIPAMFNYRKAAQLVEKLEMVRLLGAGRVVLYDANIAPNVRSVLRLYTQEWAAGNETLEVVVHSWKLPQLRLHYWGQVAAIEDCLYRYGWLSKYMVFDDLDEFIIPLQHKNWHELIAERELSPGYGAFMFRSSVMNQDHASPAKGFEIEARKYDSLILGFTQRDDYVYAPLLRSKLIVNPRKIESIGVHHVYEGYGATDVIPLDQGLVYHYRWPILPCGPEVKDNRVSTRFGKSLLVRLKSIWSKLRDVQIVKTIPRSNSTRETCYKEMN